MVVRNIVLKNKEKELHAGTISCVDLFLLFHLLICLISFSLLEDLILDWNQCCDPRRGNATRFCIHKHEYSMNDSSENALKGQPGRVSYFHLFRDLTDYTMQLACVCFTVNIHQAYSIKSGDKVQVYFCILTLC